MNDSTRQLKRGTHAYAQENSLWNGNCPDALVAALAPDATENGPDTI